MYYVNNMTLIFFAHELCSNYKVHFSPTKSFHGLQFKPTTCGASNGIK